MRQLLLVFLLGLLLSVLIYPASIFHISNSLPDKNDTRLIAYIIGQAQNNLLVGGPLFFGTYFAPYPNTLTYSDPFVATAVITLPARLVTDNPIAIFNLAYLINSTLTFATSYYFFSLILENVQPRRLSKRALLASLLFFLSGYHLTYLPHLQVFSLWATFSALNFFLLFQKQGKSLYLNLFYLFTFIQLTDSPFPVFLTFFAAAIFFLANPSNLKKIVINAVPFLLCAFVFSLPYLQMVRAFPESARPIRDAAHFSLGLEEIFTKYHSWTPITLLLILFFLPRKRTTSEVVQSYLILATGIILSLGPVVKIFSKTVKFFDLPIPLPYTLFYYFFPGFQGLRTPNRFIILALIGASAFIAARLPRLALAKWGLPLILSLLLFEAGLPKLGFFINPTPPPIYEEIKNLPSDSVILELPIYLWNRPNHELESVRSIYSLYHGHRRIGGYSGFAPLAWIRLVENLNARGLDPENTTAVSNLGVTHIVKDDKIFPL